MVDLFFWTYFSKNLEGDLGGILPDGYSEGLGSYLISLDVVLLIDLSYNLLSSFSYTLLYIFADFTSPPAYTEDPLLFLLTPKQQLI